MTVSTASWLTTQGGANLALSLVIEGSSIARTTTSDASGMNTAWAATDWSSAFKPGLFIIGEISQEIEPQHPQTRPTTLTFRFADYDNSLMTSLLQDFSTTANITEATVDIDNDDQLITVTSTTGFAASGDAYINGEAFHYESLSATGFATTDPRTKYAIGMTSAAEAFGYYHKVSDSTSYKPLVSSQPLTWEGRLVALYLHHLEGGTWTTRTNAKLLWTGRITARNQTAAGTVEIVAEDILADLRKTLPVAMLEAQLAPGLYFDTNMPRMQAFEEVGTSTVNRPLATLSGTGEMVTYQAIIGLLNQQFQTWATGADTASTWSAEIAYPPDADGPRVEITASGGNINTSSVAVLSLGLHASLWSLLGFSLEGTASYLEEATSTTYKLHRRWLARKGATTFQVMGDLSPAEYLIAGHPGGRITVANAIGTYNSQAASGMPNLGAATLDGTGFLRVGEDFTVAVKQNSVTEYEVTTVVSLTGAIAAHEEPGQVARYKEYRVSSYKHGTPPVPKIQQIWVDRGSMRSLVLRSILSTGTASYNSATHDLLPWGMSIGIPYSLVDVPSFAILPDDVDITRIFDKPASFAEDFEKCLAPIAAYCVLREGKIALRQTRLDSSTVGAAWTLIEANKAQPGDRMTVQQGTNGILNRMELKYGRGVDNEYHGTVVVEELGSLARFGKRRVATMESPGFAEVGDSDALVAYFSNTAADNLAFFSRSVAVGNRTYNYTLLGMCPGETVLVTDSYPANPRSSSRGITSEPGWLTRTTFNLETGVGQCSFLMLPEVPPDKVTPWAPAARVDDTASNGGFVTSTYFQCLSHAFSDTSEDNDVSYFAVGYECRARSISPSAATSALTFNFVPSVVDTTNMRIHPNAAVAGWVSTKKYIIEFRDYATVVAAQKNFTHMADDATGLVSAGIAAYRYGGAATPASIGTKDYGNRYVQYSADAHTTAYPLTVADWDYWLRGVNNYLAYVSRTSLIRFITQTNRSITGTSFSLVYGPQRVVLYDPDRSLSVRVRGSSSSGAQTATFRVSLCANPARGLTTSSLTFAGGRTTNDSSTTVATTATWLTEFTLDPTGYIQFDPALKAYTTFVTVEAKSANAGTDARFTGLSVREQAL